MSLSPAQTEKRLDEPFDEETWAKGVFDLLFTSLTCPDENPIVSWS